MTPEFREFLKSKGLEGLEKTVETTSKEFFTLMTAVAEYHKATWATPLLTYAEAALKPLIDKIDGQEG